MDVENSLESHKPVEIGDLRPWCACRGAGYTESPTRRGGAADGPLRAGENPWKLSTGPAPRDSESSRLLGNSPCRPSLAQHSCQ